MITFQVYYDLYEKEKERYEKDMKLYIGRDIKPLVPSGAETTVQAADDSVVIKTEPLS